MSDHNDFVLVSCPGLVMDAVVVVANKSVDLMSYKGVLGNVKRYRAWMPSIMSHVEWAGSESKPSGIVDDSLVIVDGG